MSNERDTRAKGLPHYNTRSYDDTSYTRGDIAPSVEHAEHDYNLPLTAKELEAAHNQDTPITNVQLNPSAMRAQADVNPNLIFTQRSGGNLYVASRQWASRPEDECFQSIEELHRFCQDVTNRSSVKTVSLKDMKAELVTNEVPSKTHFEQDIVLGNPRLRDNPTLSFSNHSFRRMLPFLNPSPNANFLQSIPEDLAVQNLNYCLSKSNKASQILVYDKTETETWHYDSKGNYTGDGRSPIEYARAAKESGHSKNELLIRAFTSHRYTRVGNEEITRILLVLQDELGYGIPGQHGTNAASRIKRDRTASTKKGTGLYASQQDMFALIAFDDIGIDIPGHELVRCLMIGNNEVGEGSFFVNVILCDYICMNHIIWGMKNSLSMSARHVGQGPRELLKNLPLVLAAAKFQEAGSQEATIHRAMQLPAVSTAAFSKAIGIRAKKQAIIKELYGNKKLFSKSALEEGFAHAEGRQHLNPLTVWGIVQGVTAAARAIPHYDRRHNVQRNASRYMESQGLSFD